MQMIDFFFFFSAKRTGQALRSNAKKSYANTSSHTPDSIGLLTASLPNTPQKDTSPPENISRNWLLQSHK